ncbi:MAG: lipocalin family protein [Flavobacterium sp.]|nr:lipocalin family protein [Flavobacterium sp.]MDP5028062.1 lipocalin family protein [Flavobacterium sp.]
MKSIKSILSLLVLSIAFVTISCDNEPIDPAIDISSSSSITGTYYMTAFNSSIPTDLNGDGSASTNQMNETNCFNGSFITLNSNNTFVADSKGIDINTNGTTSTIECFDEGNFTGTWALSGNQLSITYLDGGVEYTDVATLSGNTIVSTVQNGEVVGTTSGGEPIYLTSNLQIVFTK